VRGKESKSRSPSSLFQSVFRGGICGPKTAGTLALMFLTALCPASWAQPVFQPPVILVPPQSQLVMAGTNVTFTVAVYSQIAVTYQWSFGAQAIAGATSQSLALNSVAVSQGGTYSVTVSNVAGSASSSATLAVVSSVFQNPPSVSLGVPITLSFSMNFGVAPQVQWLYYGTNIPGATAGALNVSNPQVPDAAAYSVVVRYAGASLTLPAVLNVDPTFTKITSDPAVQRVVGVGPLANYPDGVIWADYNNDGYLDLLVWNQTVAQPHSPYLYLGNPSGSFSPAQSGTLTVGFDTESTATWADFNNDGYPDLLVTHVGHAQLFQNNQNGTFTPVTAGQLTAEAQLVSPADIGSMDAAWADYDNDGRLDVLLNTHLYRNTGDGFTNTTPSALGPSAPNAGRGRAWGDYDNDGYADVFVASLHDANLLYHNNGDGTFTDRAPLAGVNGGATAGGAWADYDNDGFLDLFVENGPLYHNNRDGTFSRSAAFDAIWPPNTGSAAIAWGDYDNDGFVDLFLSNFGTLPPFATITRNLLYHNNGDGTFTRITTGSPVNDADSYGGCSFADYNNDGFLDLYVASQTGHNLLYLNNANSNSWLKVKCVGKISNAAAIGAKVRVKAFYRGASRWQLREISGGDGDNVSQPLLAHFGLGDAPKIDILRIEWPSGIVQEMTNVPVKQAMTVQEQGVAIYPRVQNLVVGSNFTYTAKSTFTAALGYQWQSHGTNLPGQTSSTLIIQNAQAADAGGYTVQVTQLDGSVVSSSPALLRWPGPPIITSSPTNQFVLAGTTVTLTVGVVPSATPLSYQWSKDGVIIDTHSALVLTNVGLSAGGNYSVSVVNGDGTNTSSVAAVTVVSVTRAPNSVSLGATIMLRVGYLGPLVSTFQWQDNGTNIPGATTAQLTITNAQLADADAYGLVVSNATGTLPLPLHLRIDPTFTKLPTNSPVLSATNGVGVWGDYDNDGFLDLYITRASGANLLFHNNGDGTFNSVSNAATAAGSPSTGGAAWGDYDNDGRLDLLLADYGTAYPYAPALFHNDGNGNFTRVVPQGVYVTGFFSSAAWADFDDDGFLDILLTANTGNNLLFRGDHGTNFLQITTGPIVTEPASVSVPAWGDYDNDGFDDLLRADTVSPPHYSLYHNNGDGTFTKITAGPIAQPPAAGSSDGVGVWGDYDNDGFLDLFVGNSSGPSFLYHNNGDGTFSRVTQAPITTDVGNSSEAIWGDYDNDGFLDLYVMNFDSTNWLYHNNGDGTFSRVDVGSPVNDSGQWYAGSFVDYDNDGFPDIYVSSGGQFAFYRNNGNSNNWAKFRLAGTLSNRAAIGAKVRVHATIRGRAMWQLRELSTADGFSASGLHALFGLGDATNMDLVQIEWPSGIAQGLTNVAAKQFLTVTEQGVAIFPRAQNLVLGSNFTFTAKTTFTGPLNYQWSFNGMPLSSQTNATYVLQGAQQPNLGGYTVVVTGPGVPGAVSSSPALLRLPAPPLITRPPQDKLVQAGFPATLSVQTAPSATPLTYQWFFNGLPITNATSSILQLTNLKISDGGYYSVNVANNAGSTTSAVAAVTVAAVFPNPSSVSLGASATFQVVWVGANLGFQWASNGISLPGATRYTITITNVQLSDASAYSVVVNNSAGAIRLAANVNVDPTFTKITSGDVVKSPEGCAAWGDVDNDGYLDLISFRGRVFHNNSNGTFTATQKTGPLAAGYGANTMALGDVNNAGSLDVIATQNDGTNPPITLLKNLGNGTFTNDVHAGDLTTRLVASVADTRDANWVDYNNDGWLDVFVVGVFLAGNQLSALFQNNGDGTFSFIPNPAGPVVVGQGGNGCAWADYDNDGFEDLFDTGFPLNLLYHNNGDGTFTQITDSPPAIDSKGQSTGCAWGDYDNDGLLDLFVANGANASISPTNFLYHNEGNGQFTRVVGRDPVARAFFSIGGSWGDYDNDGFLDLLVINSSGQNAVYHNNGDGTFASVTLGNVTSDTGGFLFGGWADYDNDGFLDLFVDPNTGGTLLYRNNGNSNGWVKVKCVGVLSNRPGIGAKVRVKSFYRGASRWQLREITGGDSWGETKPLLAHFGLGDATNIDIVRIEWPSGIVQELPNVPMKQQLTVYEQGVAIYPRVQNLVVGSNNTFTARTTFSGSLTYQWSFNGTPLAGATNPTLLIQGAQTNNLGGYTVAVTAAGSAPVSSSPALLRWTGPPLITAQPQSWLAAVGNNVTLTAAVAPSATPLTYQWYYYGQPISGANSSAVTLTNVTLATGGDYSLIVNNGAGSSSALATLTVLSVTPQQISVSLGANPTFAASWAPASTSLGFAWQFNGLSLTGATNASLTVNNAQVSDAGIYTVIATSTNGTTSVSAVLDVDSTFTKITTDPVVSAGERIIAWCDVDNDGYLDLLSFTGRVFHNNRDGTFTAGLPDQTLSGGYYYTFALGDANNDGFLDVVAGQGLTPPPPPEVLLENTGQGTFTNVARAGSLTSGLVAGPSGVGWVDYDNDGWLDVFVGDTQGTQGSVLFRNNGGNSFSALSGTGLLSLGFGIYGAAWADYDNDGYMDLFVTAPRAQHNLLYRNNGNGTFTRVTTSPPGRETGDSVGCAWGDYDNDGFPDLFVANGGLVVGGTNFLYHNEGNGTFRKVLTGPIVETVLGSAGGSWGDYDNDGFLDLFVSHSYADCNGTNSIYHNNGDGTFTAISLGSLTSDVSGWNHYIGWGDYDNDGFLDLFVSECDRANLYHNMGNSNGWLKVKCAGVVSNRPGIGAKVRVKAFYRGASRWQLREITGGDGVQNSQPLLAHFGLGDATNIDIVRIEWPSGIVQEMTNVPVKQSMTVTEQGVAIYPRVQNLAVGSNSTFTAKTTFSNILSYQWSFNGMALAGGTNPTLVIQNAQATNAGGYTVTVSQSGGSPVSSSPALLRLPGPPVIATQPQSQTVAAGSTVTLNVGVVPSVTVLSYQWSLNGTPINGATRPTLALTNISAAGNYVVTVTNSSGSTSSAIATLTVVPAFRLTGLPLVGGLFPLQIQAGTGQVFVLQASTNLVNWQPILTNTATNGTFNYLDPDSPLFNRRFYRGVTP